VPEVRLLPGREFPMDDDARARFRSRWRELLEGDPTKSRIYKDMGNGVATAGIEYYLPLFFEETATVFDYLGEQSTVVLHGDLEPAFQRFWQDTKDRYRLVQGDPERPVLPPEALFLNAEQFYTRANDTRSWRCAATRRTEDSAEFQKAADLSVVRGAEDPLARFKQHAQRTPHRVLVLAESDGRRESLLDFLRASQLTRRPSTRWRSSRPATRSSASPPRRWPRLLVGEEAASTSSPRPSCSPPRPPRAGARSRSRSATSRR
jgi:transcription-repair coupling factor (superfamily II helicase)